MKTFAWNWLQGLTNRMTCRRLAGRGRRLSVRREIETLEARQMLTVTSAFSSGKLTLTAGATDAVVLSADAGTGTVLLNGATLRLANGQSVLANKVTRLQVNGGSGANNIDLSAMTRTTFTAIVNGGIKVSAGDGNDTLIGSEFGDALDGQKGNDLLRGLAGNDSLIGGDGLDTAIGGEGNDSISGLNDNDSLQGDAGNDTVLGGAGDDCIRGGAGQDSLSGDVGRDLVHGGADSDKIAGGADNDGLAGGDGNDTITGLDGKDTLVGGVGDDCLAGGNQDDLLLGEAGNDNLDGQGGKDTVAGGSGVNQISGAGLGATSEIDEAIVFDAPWLSEGDADRTLAELNRFVTETIVPVELGPTTGRRSLTFTVDPQFDRGDQTSAVTDRLLVYLFDAANPTQTLVDQGVNGSALLSVGESSVELASSLVRFDGRNVEIDITNLTAPKAGLLKLQLLGADTDAGSQVTIGNVRTTVAADATAIPSLATPTVARSAGTAVDAAALSDAPDVEVLFNNIRATGTTYTLDAKLRNNGAALGRQTVLAFPNLPIGVTLTNASGTLANGTPYLSFANGINDGGLQSGDDSQPVIVTFANTTGAPVPLSPEVLSGQTNRAPVFAAVAPQMVLPGGVLEIVLNATDADGDRVTFSIANGSTLPTSLLTPEGRLTFRPATDQVGTYTFDVVASDGVLTATQSLTVDVVADPIETTRISGTVLDGNDLPLAGVTVAVGTITGTTLADGSFELDLGEGELPGDVLQVRGNLIVGASRPRLAITLAQWLGNDVQLGVDNVATQPIRLHTLDVAHATAIAANTAKTVTNVAIPGFSLTVAAGNLRTEANTAFVGTVTTTNIPIDAPPVPLPEGFDPDQIVLVAPVGLTFTNPAPVTFANLSGLDAGEVLDLIQLGLSGEFLDVGDLIVSPDGTRYTTTVGGLTGTGLVFPIARAAEALYSDPDDNPLNFQYGVPANTATQYGTSTFDLHTGSLTETHSTVSYNSLGADRSVTLVFDSLRADARQIVHFGFDKYDPSASKRAVAKLTVKRDNFEFEVPSDASTLPENQGFAIETNLHLWSLPFDQVTGQAGLVVDLRHQPTGTYDYTLLTGIMNVIQTSPNSGFLSGKKLTSQPGTFVHVNTADSPFGAGWGVAGVQSLLVEVIKADPRTQGGNTQPGERVLLIDGDGSELIFTQSPGSSNYTSPPGDFTTFEKLGTAHYRRTTKEKTVYEFQNNQLTSMRDRNGNTTTYEYSNGRLSRIVDPVGLGTSFQYTSNTVTITDPFGRATRLDVTNGRLNRVTDPDNSTRTWSYDSFGKMTSEVDQVGNREEAFYGFHGRGERAIRKDGTEMKITPAIVAGVFSTDATSRLFNSPPLSSQVDPVAQIIDANGKVETVNLDQKGQQEGARDALGRLSSFQRNDQNLIRTMVDGLARRTEFGYDERGNITTVRDPFAQEAEQLNMFSPAMLSEPFATTGLAVGDFDQNGKQDIAASTDSGVTIFYRGDDGQFDPKQGLSSFTASELEAADMNGDGVPDLIRTGFGAIQVAINLSDGTFLRKNSLIVNAFAQDMAIADMDGDGDLDVIIPTNNDAKMGVILAFNKGDGTFERQTYLAAPSLAQHVDVADLNRDGLLDIIADGFPEASLFLSGPNGFTRTAIEGSFGDISVGEVGFFTTLDYIIGNKVYINGTFPTPTFVRTIFELNTEQPLFHDIDLDGNLDVVSGDGVAINKGGGLFEVEQSLTFLNGQQLFQDAMMTDVTGDGIKDFVAISQESAGVIVLEGRPDGTLLADFDAIDHGDFAPVNIALPNPNVIGGRSLVTSNSDGSLSLYEIQNGELVGPVTQLPPGLLGPGLVEHSNFGLVVHAGRSPTIFSPRTSVDEVVGDQRQELIFTEFAIGRAGDMKVTDGLGGGILVSDALAHVGKKTFTFYRFDGLRADGSRIFTPVRSGDTTSIDQFEFLGNGVIGLGRKAGSGTKQVFFFERNPTTGNFGAAQPLFTDNGDALEVVDLNRDGVLDLITTVKGTGGAGDTVRVRLGIRGSGSLLTFRPALEFKAGPNVRDIAVGDIQGDGILDIATANNGATISIILGQPNGNFEKSVDVLVGPGASHLLLQDLNTDGKLDLIFPFGLNGQQFFGTRINHFEEATQTQNLFTVTYDPTFSQITSVRDELGHTTNFQIDPNNGNLLSITRVVNDGPDIIARKTYNSNGLVVTETDANGRVTRYFYDAAGRLNRIVFAEGTADQAEKQFEYDQFGNPTAEINERGHRTETAYDVMNRPIRQTDAIGNVTTYTYDARGNRTSMTNARGNFAGAHPNDFTTRYFYDGRDRLIREEMPLGKTKSYTYDKEGNKTSETDPLGRVTRYTYDDRDRLVATTDPSGGVDRRKYNNANVLTQVIDALGRVTQYKSDLRNRVTERIDALGNSTFYTYDLADRLTEEKDALGRITKYFYDDLDRPIRKVDALKQASTTEYDAVGNVVAMTDVGGFRTTMQYDARDRLTQQTDPLGAITRTTYDAVGNKLTMTDARGNVTTMAYDSLNRVITETDALGNAATTEYDPVGNVIRRTDRLGRATQTEFDALNREVAQIDSLNQRETKTYDVADQVIRKTDKLGQLWQYQFDARGNILRESDPLGASVNYTFDAENNRTSMTDKRGFVWRYEYDALNRIVRETDPLNGVSTVTFDAVGNVIRTTDKLNRTTAMEYDALNRVVRTVDALGGVTSHQYDALGRMLRSIDQIGRATNYSYDALGRVLSVTQPGFSTTSNQYDLHGNLIRATDPRGNITNYQYDALNRKTQATDALGGTALTAYDAVSNVVATTDARNFTTTYAFDVLNRQTSQTDPLGGSQTMTYDALDRMISKTDEIGRVTTMTYDALGKETSMTDPNGEVTHKQYDAASNLIAETDERNFTTTHQYDALNRKTRTVDPLGASILMTYDALGNELTRTDKRGNVWTSTYDTLNRKTSTRDPLNGLMTTTYDAASQVIAETDELGRRTTKTYDGRGNLLTVADPVGQMTAYTYDLANNLTSETDKRGNQTTFNYDVLNRRTRIEDAAGQITRMTYDAVGNQVFETDPRNFVTTMQYDARNRRTHTTDPLGGTVVFAYDLAGQRISETDKLGRVTRYTFDGVGMTLTKTDPLNGVMTYAYDEASNRISVTDVLGQTTQYEFDALGRQTRMTDALGNFETMAYDANGNELAKTDRRGNSWTHEYDKLNRRTRTTDPFGNFQTATYDAAGQITQRRDELGRVTKSEYDALGREVRRFDPLNKNPWVTQYDPNGNVTRTITPLNEVTTSEYDVVNRRTRSTDADGNVTQTSYDLNGNPVTKTNARGFVTTTTFDALNRPTTITDPLGGVMTSTYDAADQLVSMTDELNRTTTYTYDALGNRTSETDPLNQRTDMTYDAKSRRTRVTDPLGHATDYEYDVLDRVVRIIDARNGVTTYAYDANGNKTSITDSVGNMTAYTFDKLNRVATDTNSLGATRTLTYDAVGNRVSRTDRNGRVIRSTYDTLDRLVKDEWLTNNKVVHTINTTYDAVGRPLTRRDNFSSLTFTYSPIGEVISVTNKGTAGVPEVLQTFQYDAMSNRTSRVEKIGSTVGATTISTFDELDRFTRIVQTGTNVTAKRVDFSYDDASQLTGEARFSDAAGTISVANTTKTYDSASRLTGIVHSHNATPINTYILQYDAASRMTHLAHADGTTDFNYDATNQLIAADHAEPPVGPVRQDETYSYDLNGNRTNPGYQTGTNNRLTTDGTFNYEYDGEGNRIRQTEIATGLVTSFTFDHNNRLTQAVRRNAAGVIVMQEDFTYDSLNRRIERKVDTDGTGGQAAVTTDFVYDGAQIALTFNAAGQVTRRVLSGREVDQILAEQVGNETLWNLTDWQRTVRDVLDTNGDLVNHLVYDSFGRITSETNAAIDHLFSYTGREFDELLGLYYMRARYYDPTAGRFIGEDPKGFEGGSTNLSSYVNNSPLRFTDPSGLKPKDEARRLAEKQRREWIKETLTQLRSDKSLDSERRREIFKDLVRRYDARMEKQLKQMEEQRKAEAQRAVEKLAEAQQMSNSTGTAKSQPSMSQFELATLKSLYARFQWMTERDQDGIAKETWYSDSYRRAPDTFFQERVTQLFADNESGKANYSPEFLERVSALSKQVTIYDTGIQDRAFRSDAAFWENAKTGIEAGIFLAEVGVAFGTGGMSIAAQLSLNTGLAGLHVYDELSRLKPNQNLSTLTKTSLTLEASLALIPGIGILRGLNKGLPLSKILKSNPEDLGKLIKEATKTADTAADATKTVAKTETQVAKEAAEQTTKETTQTVSDQTTKRGVETAVSQTKNPIPAPDTTFPLKMPYEITDVIDEAELARLDRLAELRKGTLLNNMNEVTEAHQGELFRFIQYLRDQGVNVTEETTKDGLLFGKIHWENLSLKSTPSPSVSHVPTSSTENIIPQAISDSFWK